MRFEGRVLWVDGAIADKCGRLTALGESNGRRIHMIDAMLAATAAVHGLTLVTRSATDFAIPGLRPVLNPWGAAH